MFLYELFALPESRRKMYLRSKLSSMNKIIKSLLYLAAGMAITTCSSPQTKHEKVILAVFAHPDDESSVGPVLAKYAAEGVSVYIAVATDGRLGVTPHAGIPAGDSLAAVRTGEMKCAAEQLGIHPPVMIGMHDQLKMHEGLVALSGQLDTIRKNVIKLFDELKPDIVLTWGPSGWTGHHDHRLVGSVVTEAFASKVWTKPIALYYSEIPAGSFPKESPLPLATVDPKYLTIKVSVTDKDYDKAKAAWLCHKSQYTPEMVEQLHQLMRTTEKGVVYFRPFEFTGNNSFFP